MAVARRHSATRAARRDQAPPGLVATAERLRRRAISPVAVVRDCLARIEAQNPRLNAFITVSGSDAMRQAQHAEAKIGLGVEHAPLNGIPIGVKDMFDTAGMRTTAAFEPFSNRVPSRDALAV